MTGKPQQRARFQSLVSSLEQAKKFARYYGDTYYVIERAMDLDNAPMFYCVTSLLNFRSTSWKLIAKVEPE